MNRHSKISAIAPIVAIAAAGLVSAGSAEAATTYVTAATAGTKIVGASTYIWGTTDALIGAKICSQVLLTSGWSTSQCSTVKSDHSYTIELTYGKTSPGTYTFHAVTGGAVSPAVKLTRVTSAPTTPAPTTPAPAPTTPAPSSTSATRYTYATATNVRSAASTTAAIAGSLPAGTQVTGTISGTWLKVSTPAQYAGSYISTTVLTSTAPASTSPAPTTTTPAPTSTSATRYTYAGTTNVRSAASTSSTVVGTLPPNSQVTGTISGTWLKLSTPAQYAGRYISTTVLTNSPVIAPTSTTGTVYAGGVLGNAYTLYTGYNGVKVYLAQKALGMSPGPMDSTMDADLASRLKSFQANHGLPATGILDEATWNVLPIESDAQGVRYPFTIDSWAKTSDVMDNAQRDVKVTAAIAFAMQQQGKPYIWGGTGPMGFDCSGLLLQAVRAGGMTPQNVGNFIDVAPASDLSNRMWQDAEFEKGSLADLHLGDLIYYGGSDGVAHHVSMYIGDGQVINAVGSAVQVSSLDSTFGWSKKLGVNRAFAL